MTIFGTVRDASGVPVVGLHLELNGDVSVMDFSTFDGSFLFQVEPGAYRLESLMAPGCALSGGSQEIEVHADHALELTVNGADCVTSEVADQTNDGGRTFTLSNEIFTILHVAEYRSEQDVIERIERNTEELETSCVQTIAGFPAIESTFVQEFVTPGILGEETRQTLSIGTSLAVGSTLVTFDSRMDPGALDETQELARMATRHLSPKQIEKITEPSE